MFFFQNVIVSKDFPPFNRIQKWAKKIPHVLLLKLCGVLDLSNLRFFFRQGCEAKC